MEMRDKSSSNASMHGKKRKQKKFVTTKINEHGDNI